MAGGVSIGELVAKLRADTSEWERNLAQGARGAQKFSDNVSSTLKTGIGTAIGFITARLAQASAQWVREIGKLGLEAKVQESAFESLSRAAGMSSERLVASLQSASGEILNVSDAMTAASRAIVQGFDESQIVKVMEAARQLAKIGGTDVVEAFNAITQAITTGMTRQLKSTYGVVIDVDQAVKDFATTNKRAAEDITEVGKSQAILAAFLVKSEQAVKTLATAHRTESEEVQRLAANYKQLKEDLGKLIPYGELAQAGNAFLEVFRGLGDRLAAFQTLLRANFEGVRSLFVDLQPLLAAAGSGIAGFFAALSNGINVVLIPLRSLAAGMAAILEGDYAGAMGRMQVAFNNQLANVAAGSQALRDLALGQVGGGAAPDRDTAREATRNASMRGQVTAPISGGPNAFAAELFRPQVVDPKQLDAFRKLQEELAATALSPVDQKFEALRARLADVTKGLGPFREAGEALAETIIRLAREAEPLDAELSVLLEDVKRLTDSLGLASEGFEPLDLTLRGFGTEVEELGSSLSEQADLFNQWGIRASEAGDALSKLTITTGLLETAMEQVEEPLDPAVVQKIRDAAVELQALTLEGRGATEAATQLRVAWELFGQTLDELTPKERAQVAQLMAIREESRRFSEVRTMYLDIFNAVGGAFEKLATGIIQGTQTVKQAFKNLGQYIIVEFAQRVIRQALSPLINSLAQLATGLTMQYLGGGGGGGGLGTAVASGAVQLAVDQSTGNLVAVGGRGGGSGVGGMLQAGSAGASLAGSFPGLANLAGNWAAGGLSGALFGLPAGASGMGAAIELGVDVAGLGWAATDATAGVAGFGGSISSLAGPLAALGIALNIGLAAFGPDPLGPSAIGTYGGTLAGAGIGAAIGSIVPGIGTVIGALLGGALGGSAGGFLGGLFGGKPQLTHAQREQRETSRVLGAASAGQADILSARTYQDLYDKLITYSSGYVGGTSGVALSPSFRNEPGGLSQDVFREMAGRGLIRLPPQFGGVEDFMATNMWTGAGGGWGPTAALPVGPGNQNPYYPTVTYEGFREIARLHPDWLQFGIQAGVTPGNLTGGNQALAESTRALMEQLNEVQDKITEIVADLFKEITELTDATDPAEDAIAAFREGLEKITEAAQKNIDQQRIAMLDLTDPKAILEQTAKIRDLIHQRYEGEIDLIRNFTANIQQAAEGWRTIGDALRAQVDEMRLGPFGPTNPSLALTQTTTAFDDALAAFREDQSLTTADAVARAIDPLLTAASAMYARPSTEFRSIFDATASALEEVAGYADEQATTLEETIAEVLGEGNTIEQLTADNTAAVRVELVALREDVLHMLGEIGYGDEAALSSLTQSLIDANTPDAVAVAQQLSEAQRQTVLLAIIAQNTAGMDSGAPAEPEFVQTPWGLVTPANARALYGSYSPPSYQHGTDYVPRTGPAFLHRGEMVIPAEETAAVRAGAGEITLSIGAINVSGAVNPRETADEIIEILERRLRAPGRLRAAVQDVARNA